MLLDVTELKLKVHRNCALNEHHLPVFLMELLLPEIENSWCQSLHILVNNRVPMNRNQNLLSSTVHSNAVVVVPGTIKIAYL